MLSNFIYTMIGNCLILLLIPIVVSKECPNGYLRIKVEDVCIHLSSRAIRLSNKESYCESEAGGGVPFVRRLTDDGLDELGEILLMTVERMFPLKVFVGIKRDSALRSTKWIFSNNEGTVEESEYPLWSSDPSNLDCGIVVYKQEFKVQPYSCGQQASYICEKNDEPCEFKSLRYVNYHQRCLGILPREDSFMSAESFCDQVGGHVFPYKDGSQTNSVGAVIYNSVALDGGVYAGLQKNPVSGKWEYDSGEEETSRWDPNDPRSMDCGVHGFLNDASLGLFTMSCDESLRILCEYKGKYLVYKNLK